MTPGFSLPLGVVVAGSAGCWYVVARARRESEQVHPEVERLDAAVEQALRRSRTNTRNVNRLPSAPE